MEYWKFLLIDGTQKVFFLYSFWDWMSPKTLDSNADVSDHFREGRNLFQSHVFPKVSTCPQLVLSTLPLSSAILCLLALLVCLQHSIAQLVDFSSPVCSLSFLHGKLHHCNLELNTLHLIPPQSYLTPFHNPQTIKTNPLQKKSL